MPDDVMTAIQVSFLYGSWELAKWDRVDADGSITYPYGEGAKGRIFYDPNGRMSAILMNSDWPKGGMDPVNGFMAYSGTFELKGDVVHHAVDMCSDPRFVGMTLRRRVVIDGEEVALETLAPVGLGERASTHRLFWRRHR